MANLDGIIQRCNLLRIGYFLDSILCRQNLVDTLQRSHTLLDAVASLREVLDRLQRGVKNHQVINEATRIDRTLAREDEITSKPKHNHNHAGAQELTHRVSRRLTDGHTHGGVAILVIHSLEAVFHLLFSNERLDDAQSTQRLLYLTDAIAPL